MGSGSDLSLSRCQAGRANRQGQQPLGGHGRINHGPFADTWQSRDRYGLARRCLFGILRASKRQAGFSHDAQLSPMVTPRRSERATFVEPDGQRRCPAAAASSLRQRPALALAAGRGRPKQFGVGPALCTAVVDSHVAVLPAFASQRHERAFRHAGDRLGLDVGTAAEH